MRTKIFLAFILIILTILFSNFLFESLIIDDFDNYHSSIKDDQIFWIITSIKSSYHNEQWDFDGLSESMHWAMMLGFNAKMLDKNGLQIISSNDIMDSLSPAMKTQMKDLFHISLSQDKNMKTYPVFVNPNKVGTLLIEPFPQKHIKERELAFKEKTRNFLIISILIATTGAIIMLIILLKYLANPIINLKLASENIAKGDFKTRVDYTSSDEIGVLSKTFNQMAETLQKEEKLRKHLMSNIAHELRTPLTIIKSQIETFSEGIITDTKKTIKNIQEETERLISLVKGIEDITFAEASFFEKNNLSKVNIKDLFANLSDEFSILFKEKGLSINLLNTEDIIVSVDIEKFKKIIRNLFSNSLKFTNKGGVSISYWIENNKLFIEISDTGKGIAHDELPFIFNRFHKSDKSLGGLGLGLSIVKELINAIKGSIEITSKINQGTTVKLYLPHIPLKKRDG